MPEAFILVALFSTFYCIKTANHSTAGDTAQCISNDSSFRFAEVKDLFYSQYTSTSEKTNQGDLSKPVLFTLRKNYRSHQGILGLASMVMAMLWIGMD